MRKHLLSFARGPLGYVANLIATLLVHVERVPLIGRAAIALSDYVLAPICEAVCLRDGVQDEPLF